MHCTSKGPSLIGRRSRLSCMRKSPQRLRRVWPRLQQLRIILVPFVLLIWEQQRSERRRVGAPHRKAALVGSRFGCVVHT